MKSEIRFEEEACDRLFDRIHTAFGEVERVFVRLGDARATFASSWRGEAMYAFERRIGDFRDRLADLRGEWNAAANRYAHARNCVQHINEIEF